MSDDILGMVKKALATWDEPGHDGDFARVNVQLLFDWLRVLVARCEQAEAENASLTDIVLAQEDELLRRKAIIESAQHSWDHATERALQAEAALAALRQLHATAEASYQEAQLTIAGLEAERDHYREQATRLRKLLEGDHE